MSDNVFDRRRDPAPVDTVRDDGKIPYHAFGTGKIIPVRLRLIDEHGRIFQVRYFLLDEQIYANHQWLSLIFSHVVVTLHGQHLDQLLDPLQQDLVDWIACFDDNRHVPPAPGEALVKEIIRQDRETFLATANDT